MKKKTLLAVVAVVAGTVYGGVFSSDEGPKGPYVTSPRAVIEIPSAKTDWETCVRDELETEKMPSGMVWKKGPGDNVKNAPRNRYASEVYDFKADKALPYSKCVKWHRRTVDVPADYLEGKSVFFHIEIARMRFSLFVNGTFVKTSYQASLSKTIDITGYLKSGKNEIVFALTTLLGLFDDEKKEWKGPFWSYGWGLDFQGPIRLEFRPQAYVDDVFVRTHVEAKELEIQTTVKNITDKPVTVTPDYRVAPEFDKLRVHLQERGEPEEIPAKSEKTLVFKKPWTHKMLLWEPNSQLFFFDADIALLQDGKLLDAFCQKFAWREVTTKGRDLFLNGRRIFLSRFSTMGCNSDVESWNYGRWRKGRGAENSVRYHLGTLSWWQTDWDMRKGTYTIPELSMCFFNEQNRFSKEGVSEYCEGVCKMYRNNPSVLMYSLDNETVWNSTDAKWEEVCTHYVNEMRKWAPDQLMQADGDNTWNGKLDINNIHYPEGEAGVLRKRYPNAGFTLPNDLKWVTKEEGAPRGGWRTNPFIWDKPCIIGEFYCFMSPAFAGDALYDPLRWAKDFPSGESGIGDYDVRTRNIADEALRMMCTWYRYVGFAGLNPWCRCYEYALAGMVLDPLEFTPNWWAGEEYKRPVVMINDTGCPFTQLRWNVSSPDFHFEHNEAVKVDVQQGSNGVATILAKLPVRQTPYTAKTTARVGLGDATQAYMEEKLFVWPTTYDLSAYAKGLAVLGDTVDEELKALGLGRVPKVTDKLPADVTTLLVAPDSFKFADRKLTDELFARGGTVILCAQKEWQPYRGDLPKADFNHAATMSWIRDAKHPVLDGIPEEALRFWRGDNRVSVDTFLKPMRGDFRCILECGGTDGMKWSPLMEIKVDKGRCLMDSFGRGKDPVKLKLLANRVKWASVQRSLLNSQPSVLCVMAGTNTAIKTALDEIAVKYKEGFDPQAKVALVDASANLSKDQAETITANSGTLWHHNFHLSSSHPFTLSLLPKEVLGVVPVNRKDTALWDGISNFDTAWYKPVQNFEGWGAPARYWQRCTKTAEPPAAVIADAAEKGYTALTEPCALAEKAAGKGRILVDLLPWESAIVQEKEKVQRTLAQLCRNLGCEFGSAARKMIAYRRIIFNDHCNMGYWDTTAGDGKGGWSDEGRDDMRMYLINHVGKNDYEETGMPTPVPPFPQEQTILDVPFWCPPPCWNRGLGVMTFAEKDAPKKSLKDAQTLKIGGLVDELKLVNAAARCEGLKNGDTVATWTFEYEDGAEATVPMILGKNIADWKKPLQTDACKIAWSGQNKIGPRSLYLSTVKNPHPEKKVADVVVRGGTSSARYIVGGITGAREIKPCGEMTRELVLKADFADRKNVFKYPGIRHLWQGNEPPQYDYDAKTGGATFAATNGFICSSRDPEQQKECAPLKDFLHNPFEIDVDVAFHAYPPNQHCSVIAMPWSNLQFHWIQHNLQWAGLTSKLKIELGKRYNIRVRYDGWTCWMWVNSVLQDVKDSPAPMFAGCDVAHFSNIRFDGTYYKLDLYKLVDVEKDINR